MMPILHVMDEIVGQ